MQETGDDIITFKIRTFIAVVGGLVIGTNVVNSVVNNIIDNKEEIEYNSKANERRREHMKKEIMNNIALTEKDKEIRFLEEELKKCSEK